MSDPLPIDVLSEFLGEKQPRRIGVAVSGGSDSTALLLLAQEWAVTRDAEVFAATVDHGLRPEAADEAAMVARLCKGLDIPHDTLCWTGWDGAGNLQAEARAARYRLLADWSEGNRLDVTLLGHTQNDQAETFLLRLARRAGLDGLSAMQAWFEQHGQPFARPLLSVSREGLRDYLTNKNVDWVEDPSNTDPTFDRVRVREALKHLDTLGISVAGLAETSRHLKQARDLIDHAMQGWCTRHVTVDRGDVLVPLADYQRQPVEFRRRFLAAALCWVAGADYPPRSDSLARVLAELETGQAGPLHGCLLSVKKDVLRIGREFAAVKGLTSDGPRWDRWQVCGPWKPGMQLRALGEDGLRQLDNWRQAEMPRSSLLASPSVWYDGALIAAPLVDPKIGWTAQPVHKPAFFGQLGG